MRALIRIRGVVIATIAVSLLIATASAEAGSVFVAGLDAASVVPPSGSEGEGLASLLLQSWIPSLSYILVFGGLDEVTSVGIYDPAGNLLHAMGTTSPVQGEWAIPLDAIGLLFDENLSIQINTVAYPAGAIRGVIQFCAVRDEGTTWGAVKRLFR